MSQHKQMSGGRQECSFRYCKAIVYQYIVLSPPNTGCLAMLQAEDPNLQSECFVSTTVESPVYPLPV